jgi:hypothetical protein
VRENRFWLLASGLLASGNRQIGARNLFGDAGGQEFLVAFRVLKGSIGLPKASSQKPGAGYDRHFQKLETRKGCQCKGFVILDRNYTEIGYPETVRNQYNVQLVSRI